MEAGKPKKKTDLLNAYNLEPKKTDTKIEPKKIQFTLRIDENLLARMKVKCIDWKMRYNQFIEEAIERKLLDADS